MNLAVTGVAGADDVDRRADGQRRDVLDSALGRSAEDAAFGRVTKTGRSCFRASSRDGLSIPPTAHGRATGERTEFGGCSSSNRPVDSHRNPRRLSATIGSSGFSRTYTTSRFQQLGSDDSRLRQVHLIHQNHRV